MKTTRIIITAALLAASGSLFAQVAGTPPAAQASSGMTKGEVRKVDREAGKITIRHEALVGLGMPAMTMVFLAADPKFLDEVKEGDHIDFVADKANGAFTVVALQVVK